MLEKTITVIPRKPLIHIDNETGKVRKLRVCAYARVSTDLEDQRNSFEFQKQEFEERIKKNPEWEFVDMYSDRGISGTSTKNRDGFKAMIKKAMDGQIDLILIKSLSRFARNTVDCLTYLRQLAEKGVSVYFEKENITTNKDNVDLVLTIQAAIAEAESRDISEQVKWGVQKRMQKGIKKTPVGKTIGYSNDSNGNWYVNEESQIIRKIFEMFINGCDCNQIIKEISEVDENNDRKWNRYKIYRILRNERYKGTIIHQKMITTDVLTHRKVVNTGQEPMYIIDNHHQAIISPDVFDYVQLVLNAKKGGMFDETIIKSNQTPLAGLLICEKCGRTLRRVKYPYNDSHVLTCKNRTKNSEDYVQCDSGVIPYPAVEAACLDVINKFNSYKNNDCNRLLSSLLNSMSAEEFGSEIKELNKKEAETRNKLNDLLKSQLNEDINSEQFDAEFLGLKQQLKIIDKQINELQELAKNNHELIGKQTEIKQILSGYKTTNLSLIKSLVSMIVHNENGSLTFVLKKDGINSSDFKNLRCEIKNSKIIYSSFIKYNELKLNYNVVLIGGNN